MSTKEPIPTQYEWTPRGWRGPRAERLEIAYQKLIREWNEDNGSIPTRLCFYEATVVFAHESMVKNRARLKFEATYNMTIEQAITNGSPRT